MPTQAFIQAKTKGRWFEGLVRSELPTLGFEVIDSEKLKYRDKRGWDCEVRIKGKASKIEIKYDELSETTGNVAIEPRAIGHSISPIWIYGLPSDSQIDLFTMFLSDLKRYVYEYYKKHPESIRQAGEFGDWVVLLPKWEFISQPFVKKFKTINLNQNG